MFYVYFLQSESGKIYYGSTNDLRRRLAEHQAGKVESTHSHTWRLVYYEAYASEGDTREREQRLKYHGQALAQTKRRMKRSLARKS